MNPCRLLISIGLVALAASLCGCGEHRHAADEHSLSNQAETHGVEFKEGQGLLVPDLMKQLLGIKVVDVQEGKARRRIELALRVYSKESHHGQTMVLAGGRVDAQLVPFLKPGSKVIVEEGEGEIVRIESAKTAQPELIARFPASQDFQPGVFVDAFTTMTTEQEVAVIPKEAVLKTAEGDFAYVVNGKSLFRTKITIGGRDGKMVEVADGLYTGDQVVLQPVLPLRLAELQAIRGGKACADGH